MRPEEVFYSALPGKHRPEDVVPYERVEKRRWGAYLPKGRTCVILGPPWGLWAPYLHREGPDGEEGWYLGPDWTKKGDVGSFGEIDPRLTFSKDLWDWASKPTSTLAWVAPSPNALLHGTIPLGVLGQAILNHALPELGWYPAVEIVARQDFGDIAAEHRSWWRHLRPVSALVPFERGVQRPQELEAIPQLAGWDAICANSPFLSEPGRLPPRPQRPDQSVDWEPLVHPRGLEDLGMVLHARIGMGHLVVIMAKPPRTDRQVVLLREGVRRLHEYLHEAHPDPRSHVPDPKQHWRFVPGASRGGLTVRIPTLSGSEIRFELGKKEALHLRALHDAGHRGEGVHPQVLWDEAEGDDAYDQGSLDKRHSRVIEKLTGAGVDDEWLKVHIVPQTFKDKVEFNVGPASPMTGRGWKLTP